MSPTNRNYGAPLAGLDAQLAGLPISPAVRGGVQTGFDGVAPPTSGAPTRGALRGASDFMRVQGDPTQDQTDQFAGMGELLEADDAETFRTLHALNLRQERLSKNRLAQDKHWTRIKLGYQFSALEKVQDQDIYRAVLPPGSDPLRPSAVPNKALDLCNKLTETIMVDPPQPEPQAETDAEDAERAAEMAREFLVQDGGEAGTDDAALFWYSVEAATTRASAFHHYWVDPTGNGSAPLQIKAHPQATSPSDPLVAYDANGIPIPTTDFVLRYVTDDNQFTDDPSQAKLTWLPKIRADRLGREHVRLFPEDADVQSASHILMLYYSTIEEGRRRWPVIAEMNDQELSELCDWTPPRYLILLPPALRARWKLQVGGDKDGPGGSDEQRMFFYYGWYKTPSPEYPRGAMIYASGAFGGLTIDKDVWSANVPMPEGKGTDVRGMDTPFVQVRLIQDPDDRDPTGRAFMERIGSANEARATIATSYLEGMDINLHPAMYTPATSPVEGWQMDQARASGDHIPILSQNDKPMYEEPRILPDVVPVTEWIDSQMESAASLTKPVTGADNQQEVSGVARNIAVQQGQVSLSRMQQAVNGAWERHWRIKLQLALRYFTAPQMLRYVGEDGAYKQEWWTGVNFARVTQVRVRSGTGTMMAPSAKVNYVNQLSQVAFLPQEQAKDVARQSFTETLGIPDDPQQQRIERQVSAWLKGPPKGWHMQSPPPAPPPQAGQPPQPPPQPVPSWNPFAPLPMDDEPQNATVRQRRLAKLMATARFATFANVPGWQGLVTAEYSRMRNAVAQAQQAMQQAQNASNIQKAQIDSQGRLQGEQVRAQTDVQIAQMRTQAEVAGDTADRQFELQKMAFQSAVSPIKPAPGAVPVEERALQLA